jgi:hypothetical protein
MVVNSARDHPLALAQRAGECELRRNCPADELAFVGELIEQLSQLRIRLEGNRNQFLFGHLSTHI